MKLSVVILNYNVKHFLQLCLQSVEAAIQPIEAEIIVIDNSSSDDSRLMVEKNFPNVKWIQNHENVGFSKANNQAVKEAKGEYICILNPDTVIAEDTFTTLLAFAESKENLGIIGCQLIDGTGKYLPESKRNIPTLQVATKKILGFSKTYYANHLEKDQIGEASVFVGAFMLLKRSVYNKVSGFDEQYFMYGEDIDLSYRVEKAGYTNYYYGKTIAIHFKGESTLKDQTYAKRFYGAMQIFYKTHFKRNIFFNSLVFGATHILPLLSKPKEHMVSHKVESYQLVSNKIYPKLQKTLNTNLELSDVFNEKSEQVEYILDANWLSFAQIIGIIKNSKKNKKSSFKILPKKTNFILGSDSSQNRGEVIHF